MKEVKILEKKDIQPVKAQKPAIIKNSSAESIVLNPYSISQRNDKSMESIDHKPTTLASMKKEKSTEVLDML